MNLERWLLASTESVVSFGAFGIAGRGFWFAIELHSRECGRLETRYNIEVISLAAEASTSS